MIDAQSRDGHRRDRGGVLGQQYSGCIPQTSDDGRFCSAHSNAACERCCCVGRTSLAVNPVLPC